MRWKNNKATKEMLGHVRTRRKFLWRPRSFGTDVTRWLEFAPIVEEVKTDYESPFSPYISYKWIELRFGGDD